MTEQDIQNHTAVLRDHIVAEDHEATMHTAITLLTIFLLDVHEIAMSLKAIARNGGPK